jgi:hypothetical protein
MRDDETGSITIPTSGSRFFLMTQATMAAVLTFGASRCASPVQYESKWKQWIQQPGVTQRAYPPSGTHGSVHVFEVCAGTEVDLGIQRRDLDCSTRGPGWHTGTEMGGWAGSSWCW